MSKPGKSSVIQDYCASKEAQEFRKLTEEKLKANEHHEKAIEVLRKAIQLSASDPAMTPEVKNLAELFMILIDDREAFTYDFDAVMKPVVKIVKAEGRDKGGKMRAEKDTRTKCLNEIEKEAISNSSKFGRHGFQAEFVRDMLKKHPDLKDGKAILNRLRQLKQKGLIKKITKKTIN